MFVGAVAEGMRKISYAGYRFPPEVIHQAIWLYLRFTLSFRDVEDLLAERGITVSYETVRRWVNHFGPMIAAHLRKRRPKPHATWHLDEVYLKIDGRMVYLWRAVDAEGEVLDVMVQSKRNKHAALKLMRKLLKKYAFAPVRLVTDDLRSYGAAARDLGIEHLHERGRWKNNRAENSHQPTRRRERKMQRFKSACSAQKFLSAHAAVYNTFNVQRHLTSAQSHRVLRGAAMGTWRDVLAAASKLRTPYSPLAPLAWQRDDAIPRPQRGSSVREGFFRKDEFRYDAGRDAYVCPAGKVLTPIRHGRLRELAKVDYGNRGACRGCPMRARCTNDVRSVSRLENEAVLDRMAERLKKRPEILDRRREVVEHPFGSIKQWMYQGAFLMRGLANVRAEFSLTALAYNLRRALNILGVEAMTAAVAA
jgi:transposase-like protein